MTDSPVLHAQVAQQRIVFAPVALDAHVKVEEDARSKELLEIDACGTANTLDHLAAAADDDPLLRVALDDDAAIELENPGLRPCFAGRLLETVHHHGARERDLRARELQQLLADDLRREEAL